MASRRLGNGLSPAARISQENVAGSRPEPSRGSSPGAECRYRIGTQAFHFTRFNSAAAAAENPAVTATSIARWEKTCPWAGSPVATRPSW